ncbi:hypothetical protein [Variovorax fucosicus]|uniref:hypothetical protein n=1 Tax=Variovorax fucosicus TaxID=3053517 RepID=UPI002574A9CA|nr:hypothetical protein [Variovorax sp. J22G47]MDM0058886.1 hypothetical protein [Variovorax sp. J22G47]
MFAATAVSKLLLGDDPRQRMWISQAILVLAVYVVFAGVQHLEVVLVLIDASQSWALTTWNLVGGIGFYLCIRSGLNLRLKTGRSLAIPQSIWAIVGITWSYAITGPARGAVILIMILVVIFTMFELAPSKARAVAGTAFVMLCTVMVWKALTDPTIAHLFLLACDRLVSNPQLGAFSDCFQHGRQDWCVDRS